MAGTDEARRSTDVKGAAVDDIFLALNWWGRYEKIQFTMTMLPILPTALHIVSIVFIGREVEHVCAPFNISNGVTNHSSSAVVTESLSYDLVDTNNYSSIVTSPIHLQPFENYTSSSTTMDQCSINIRDKTGNLMSAIPCQNGYQYQQPRDRTFVSEWDLVCEKEPLVGVSQIIFAFGMMLGAFGFTFLSDRFGRKKTYIVADILLFILAIGTAFAPNFTVFAILRFFTGAAQQGVSLVSMILLLEQLPTMHRELASQVGILCWPLSLLVLGSVAFLTREVSWRYTQLVLAAISGYTLLQWWIVDESLRWLMANNKTDDVERIIRKAARQNRTDVEKVLRVFKEKTQHVLLPLPAANSALVEGDTVDGAVDGIGEHKTTVEHTFLPDRTEENPTFLSAIRNKRVLMVTAISCYFWFADSATYYGLILMSSTFVEDLYLGFAVNILVELPAGIVFIVLINRIGRKPCMVIYHSMAGLSLLVGVCLTTIPAAANLPGVDILVIIVSLTGKFGIAAGFGLLYTYTPELFPTNIRNTCVGLSSLAGRIGVMVSPFSNILGRHLPWAPGVIFSILCLVIPVLTYFLPETLGRELPQTLTDMDKREKAEQTHSSC